MSIAIAAIVIAEIAIDNSFVGWFAVSVRPSDPHLTRLVSALADIETAADDNVERSLEIQRRARVLRQRLEAGEQLVPLIRSEQSPRVVELLSTNMVTLETAGAELRAAQALALRSEGLTIETIAQLFGVTRQRISALLRQKAAVAGDVSARRGRSSDVAHQTRGRPLAPDQRRASADVVSTIHRSKEDR